jgi:hypothetical protein
MSNLATSRKRRAQALKAMADVTAATALKQASAESDTLFQAAAELQAMSRRMAREVSTTEPAIAVLHDNATADELRAARRRQAARRGIDVYLPTWADMAQIMPTALLRSALFSSSRSVSANNGRVLAGDRSLLVANKPIATFNNMSISFTGYELCQMDRQIYAACLDYYRDKPLVPDNCTRSITTTFYEFAAMMGRAYSANLHIAVRAGLLRLSFGQMRLRIKRADIEVPKLLSASFVDGYTGDIDTSEFRGSDHIYLTVNEGVAQLFGAGCWTAIDAATTKNIDLSGWIANFYATHQHATWLSLKKLYELSGYEASFSGFRRGFVNALEKFKTLDTPLSHRVAAYFLSKDGSKAYVHRTAWGELKT